MEGKELLKLYDELNHYLKAKGELITELEKLRALRAVKAVAFLREVKYWNLENVADIMRIVNEAKGRDRRWGEYGLLDFFEVYETSSLKENE
ncbi:hypothetical protein Tco_0670253 [Tanacetum coccineum]